MVIKMIIYKKLLSNQNNYCFFIKYFKSSVSADLIKMIKKSQLNYIYINDQKYYDTLYVIFKINWNIIMTG